MSVTVTEYRNAVSMSSDNSIMDVEINHPDYGWVPYTINTSVTNPSVDRDALLAAIGSDFQAFSQADEDARVAVVMRDERNYRLTQEVDPIVTNPLRWADLTTEKQNEWTQYRTDLLNVPQQAGFPNTINWPTKPE